MSHTRMQTLTAGFSLTASDGGTADMFENSRKGVRA